MSSSFKDSGLGFFLCKKCSSMPYLSNIGKCKCGRGTSSGSLKICIICAQKRKVCQNCLKKFKIPS